MWAGAEGTFLNSVSLKCLFLHWSIKKRNVRCCCECNMCLVSAGMYANNIVVEASGIREDCQPLFSFCVDMQEMWQSAGLRRTQSCSVDTQLVGCICGRVCVAGNCWWGWKCVRFCVCFGYSGNPNSPPSLSVSGDTCKYISLVLLAPGSSRAWTSFLA